jgi:hypothetical protein
MFVFMFVGEVRGIKVALVKEAETQLIEVEVEMSARLEDQVW